MKNFLQNQIKNNKLQKEKRMEQREAEEKEERNRIVSLLEAKKHQNAYEQKEMLNEIINFKISRNNFKSVRNDITKDDDFAYLDNGWRLEETKAKEREIEKSRRSQINIDCFQSVKQQIAKNHSEKLEENEQKIAEIQSRHKWEKDHSELINNEKISEMQKKGYYRDAIQTQIRSDQKKIEFDKHSEDEQCAAIRKEWKRFAEVDRKESEEPISKVHPSRTQNQ